MSIAPAASSILVAAIEFRQAPEHVYPEQVADVKYGTRWLKARAADLGGEPSGDATVRLLIKGWPMLDSHARYFLDATGVVVINEVAQELFQ